MHHDAPINGQRRLAKLTRGVTLVILGCTDRQGLGAASRVSEVSNT